MMNKKGALVLRDMLFMMMIVSIIFVLAGYFVNDMAINYDNTNMSEEWEIKNAYKLGNSTFYKTGLEVEATGDALKTNSTGIYGMLKSGASILTGLGKGLVMILTAPNTISSLVSGTLEDMGVPPTFATVIRIFIITILWAIVIFTIYTAFLRGSRV